VPVDVRASIFGWYGIGRGLVIPVSVHRRRRSGVETRFCISAKEGRRYLSMFGRDLGCCMLDVGLIYLLLCGVLYAYSETVEMAVCIRSWRSEHGLESYR
jgi:hypothetical protein